MDFSYFLQPDNFNSLLAVMVAIAVVVYVALHFIDAGYGIMYTKRWGPSVDNRVGWVLMESPVFIAMCLLWWFSARRTDTVPLIFFAVFQLHYFQRSFIFPLLIKGKSRMPFAIILSGITFNVLNALMQGGWIFYVAPDGMYGPEWLYTPQFIAGLAIFAAGFAINLNSDNIIRNLRMPGDTRHSIPRVAMFRYVS